MPLPRILFVDDEPNVLDAIRRLLRMQGPEWDVSFATNGAEALAAMYVHPAHVVITDIAMPEMDGKSLIHHLYKSFPEAVLIVLSGHWQPATALTEVGPHIRFLTKPVRSEILLKTIRQAVAEACPMPVPTAHGHMPQPGREPPPAVYAESGPAGWISLVDEA